MYAKFEISKKAAYTFSSFAAWQHEECWQYGARATGWFRANEREYDYSLRDYQITRAGLASGWTTCGGSKYWIERDATGQWFLVFEGRRNSFADGWSFGTITEGKVSFSNYYERKEFDARLVDWESSVPGNPSPFEDWRAILEEKNLLESPATVGEEIQDLFDRCA